MPQKVIRKINLHESQLIKNAVNTPEFFLGLDSTLEFNIARHFPTALIGSNNDYPVPNKLSNLFDNTTSTQARLVDNSVGKALTGSPPSPNIQTTPRKGYLVFDFGRKINPRKFEITLNDNTSFITTSNTATNFNPDRGVKLHFQNAVDKLGALNSGGNGASGTNVSSLPYKDNDDFTTKTIPVGTAPYKVTSTGGVENIIGDVPVIGFWDTMNDVISSTIHSLNVFDHTEPVMGQMGPPGMTCRISSVGIKDMESNEEKMFFPLDNVRESCYIYNINEERLKESTGLLKQIKEDLKAKLSESLNISFGIFPSSYDRDFGYVLKHTSFVQNQRQE